MSRKARTAVIILVILSLILAIIALLMLNDGFADTDEVVTKKGFDRTKAESLTPDTEQGQNEENAPEPVKKYESPVDFKKLKKVNPDIYAWIDIPGTNVSYPVLQNEENNRYYLNHNSDGNYSVEGSLFTEYYYNRKRFDDPLTVIYGHFMSDGSLFGSLQKYYSDETFFREHNIIHVYLEDKMKEYVIFAAVPYSNIHLLRYYNFASPRVFDAVIDDVFSVRDMSATLDESKRPKYGQKILILSTCLWGDNRQRYLIFAAEPKVNK